MYDRSDGYLRAARIAARRPLDDPLQLGQPAVLSAAARADAALLRRRARCTRPRALSLAAAPMGMPGDHPASRAQRLERRPLHERDCRKSVRARLQRRPAQSAQLRRDGASGGGPVSFRPDSRREIRRPGARRHRRRPCNLDRGVLARWESCPEVSGGVRQRTAARRPCCRRGVADHRNRRVRPRARTIRELSVRVELRP